MGFTPSVITAQTTPAQLLDIYRAGPGLLREAVKHLSADQLRARPIVGKMSSLEVVGHVIDADQFMCDRIKRTIATEKPLLVGIAAWDYLDALNYHDRDLQLEFELLEVQRRQMAEDLDRLPAQGWSREAIHTENGLVTVRELFVHAIEHLEDHTSTIWAKREALGV